jgi:hypothetical protein
MDEKLLSSITNKYYIFLIPTELRKRAANSRSGMWKQRQSLKFIYIKKHDCTLLFNPAVYNPDAFVQLRFIAPD